MYVSVIDGRGQNTYGLYQGLATRIYYFQGSPRVSSTASAKLQT